MLANSSPPISVPRAELRIDAWGCTQFERNRTATHIIAAPNPTTTRRIRWIEPNGSHVRLGEFTDGPACDIPLRLTGAMLERAVQVANSATVRLRANTSFDAWHVRRYVPLRFPLVLFSHSSSRRDDPCGFDELVSR